MKILVVDDEKLLVKGVKFNLENEGYEVTAAYDGAAAVELAKKENFDLIVMDVMMPGLSGSEACMQIREFSDVPIIMLTAKGETDDRITGFNAGADDYLPKPFDPDELLSRVRAILRRASAYQPTQLAFSDLTLDPGTGFLTSHGQSVRLSGREYQVMELFLRNPRMVFSAERILELVWGWENEAEINVVWVNISNLRKKLKSLGSHAVLRANRGLGYALEEQA